jgi:hypothetical protein
MVGTNLVREGILGAATAWHPRPPCRCRRRSARYGLVFSFALSLSRCNRSVESASFSPLGDGDDNIKRGSLSNPSSVLIRWAAAAQKYGSRIPAAADRRAWVPCLRLFPVHTCAALDESNKLVHHIRHGR